MNITVAVVAAAFGGPEVLSVIEQAVPEPGAGQVRVRVRAAGVNPIDFKLYSGMRGTDASLLPMKLGFEASGQVVEVGPDAVGPAGPITIGDEVIVYRHAGAYAGEMTVPAEAVLPKPASLSWEQAAGIMLTGTTAVHALTAVGVIGEAAKGQTVLIHGVSGGVGLLAAQIAIHDGATVIGTTSEQHFEALRGYGAIPLVYGPGLADRVRKSGGDIDAAIDCAGTDEAVDVSLELVADAGRIATIVGHPRAAPAGVVVLGGAPNADPGTEIRAAARLRLVQAVTDGWLDVVVARTFPLAEAAAAHRLVADQHAGGKVVLIP